MSQNLEFNYFMDVIYTFPFVLQLIITNKKIVEDYGFLELKNIREIFIKLSKEKKFWSKLHRKKNKKILQQTS